MEFINIFKGVDDCKCLDGTSTNTKDTFTRRVYSGTPQKDDFHSYLEDGKIPKNNCSAKCGYSGVSVNLCVDTHKDLLIDKYKKGIIERKKINSEIILPEFCYFFKFKDDAGKIKQTGEKDITHHDFYKSDAFNVASSLETVDIINLG